MFLKYILPLLIIFSCQKEEPVSWEHQMLANAPHAGAPVYDNTANFEQGLGNYKDSAKIKYAVLNSPPKMSYSQGCDLITLAINQWENAVNKPFVKVDSLFDANIVISFEFMDGKGGQLGQTTFPPHAQVENWNRPMLIDAYDVNAESDLDPLTIIVHEFGHALGLNDSQDKGSAMYRFYYDGQKMGIDDQIGARITYDNKKKFQFEGRTYLPIEDTDKPITENFKMSEFFSVCNGYPYEFTFLDESLITAIQTIRYTYDQPIQILSTYRPSACNMAVGGARYSRHMNAQALDFKFVGAGWKKTNDLFVEEIKVKGCLFQTLINTGIGGFGAYDHSFHIDTRRSGLNKWFNLEYALWGRFSEGSFFIDIEHPNGMENE